MIYWRCNDGSLAESFYILEYLRCFVTINSTSMSINWFIINWLRSAAIWYQFGAGGIGGTIGSINPSNISKVSNIFPLYYCCFNCCCFVFGLYRLIGISCSSCCWCCCCCFYLCLSCRWPLLTKLLINILS